MYDYYYAWNYCNFTFQMLVFCWLSDRAAFYNILFSKLYILIIHNTKLAPETVFLYLFFVLFIPCCLLDFFPLNHAFLWLWTYVRMIYETIYIDFLRDFSHFDLEMNFIENKWWLCLCSNLRISINILVILSFFHQKFWYHEKFLFSWFI